MRQEFTRKALTAAKDRANGACERCHAVLKTGEGEGDHILPCALGGDNSLSNCQFICRQCHKDKTAKDIGMIRKADRQRDRQNNTLKRTSRPMPGSRASGWKIRMDGSVVRRQP